MNILRKTIYVTGANFTKEVNEKITDSEAMDTPKTAEKDGKRFTLKDKSYVQILVYEEVNE